VTPRKMYRRRGKGKRKKREKRTVAVFSLTAFKGIFCLARAEKKKKKKKKKEK